MTGNRKLLVDVLLAVWILAAYALYFAQFSDMAADVWASLIRVAFR